MLQDEVSGSVTLLNDWQSATESDNDVSQVRPNDVSEVRRHLERAKRQIDTWFEQGSGPTFTRAARAVNPYESVPFVSKRAISRAYFKLYEICHSLGIFGALDKGLCSCLCEGPGGFAECIRDYAPQLELSCLTLLTDGPQIQRQREFCVWQGGDGTGDILNPHNIDAYVAYLQERSPQGCQLVTADGGFDADPMQQEQLSLPLFYAQATIALRSLGPGGFFVLKLFDTFEHESAQLLHLLTGAFERAYLVKPKTSRVCNSEKYFVGCRFKPGHGSLQVSVAFQHSLDNYNCWYAQWQIGKLNEAHAMVLAKSTRSPYNQNAIAVEFCRQHDLPVQRT